MRLPQVSWKGSCRLELGVWPGEWNRDLRVRQKLGLEERQ